MEKVTVEKYSNNQKNMKKLLFILAIVLMAGTTFAKANESLKSMSASHTALQPKRLSSSRLHNLNAQKVSSGSIYDSSGNKVGWWAYDDASGVLITGKL
jgi:hypothetical protein